MTKWPRWPPARGDGGKHSLLSSWLSRAFPHITGGVHTFLSEDTTAHQEVDSGDDSYMLRSSGWYVCHSFPLQELKKLKVKCLESLLYQKAAPMDEKGMAP